MEFPITKLSVRSTVPQLSEIPEPPSHIYVRGSLPPQGNKNLAVVGSRNYTNYGKQVVSHLIGGLRGYPISIISGLALGIDALAHKAALEAGLHTLAIPGSGLNPAVLYPRTNRVLAQRILESGGGLLSEFEPEFRATPWSFPQRNRIMVGLSHAVLLIEAEEKSGTLITARLTSEYNRELLAVPGSIFSDNSRGTHQFIKLGATPVTAVEDILLTLGIEEKAHRTSPTRTLSEEETQLIAVLNEPRNRDFIIRASGLPETQILTLLMRMELDGFIREENGVIHKIL